MLCHWGSIVFEVGSIWMGSWKKPCQGLRKVVHPVGRRSKHRGIESSHRACENKFCFPFHLRFGTDNGLQFEAWILNSISFTITFRIITFETETFYTLAKYRFCYLCHSYQSSFPFFSDLMEKIYYFLSWERSFIACGMEVKSTKRTSCLISWPDHLMAHK